MTTTQLVLLGLAVLAAVVAGYLIGRWSATREIGERSARPSPLPDLPEELPQEERASHTQEFPPYDDGGQAEAPVARRRSAPPPASAGGEPSADAAPPRQRRAAPPPASAGGDRPSQDANESTSPNSPSPRRRGPPPPASAGLLGGKPK